MLGHGVVIRGYATFYPCARVCRPSLARFRVLARFSKINRARILSHFPKNEAFDLWSATPFEYNSGGDAPPDH